MLNELLLGVISNGAYDIVKGIKNAILEHFRLILDPSVEKTLEEFPDLEPDDFLDFFGSEQVAEEIERMKVEGPSLQFDKMTEIFSEIMEHNGKEVDSDAVVRFLINEIENRLSKNEELYKNIQLHYMRDLKEGQEEIKNEIMTVQDQNNEILKQFTDFKIEEHFDLEKIGFGEVLKNFKKIGHSLNKKDENYNHIVTFEGDKVKYSLKPKSAEAAKLEPIKFNLTVILKKIGGEFVSLRELLYEAWEKGEDLIIESDEIEAFEVLKGDQRLFKWDKENTGHIKFSPNRPKPRPVRLYIPDSNASYDYLMLGYSEKIGDEYVLNNSQQKDSPVKLELRLNPETNQGRFSISGNPEFSDIHDANYYYHTFIDELQKKQKIAVKDLQRNSDVFRAELALEKIDLKDPYYQAIKRASAIPSSIVQLPWPTEISYDDLQAIETTRKVVETGELFAKPAAEASYTKNEESKPALERLMSDGFVGEAFSGVNLGVTLFGVYYELGRMEGRFTAYSSIPLEEIREKYELSQEDEVITVPIMSKEEVIFKFQNWPIEPKKDP